MAQETQRGCGYRKHGGIYLVGSGAGLQCDRLPIELEICPTCGQGIKPARGFTWVDIPHLVDGDHLPKGGYFGPPEIKDVIEAANKAFWEENKCKCHQSCLLCHNVQKMGKGCLLWIGVQFYPTIEAFEAEAKTLGISRRISTIPRGFKLGETWLLLAHTRGVIKTTSDLAAKYVPAIFRVWKPERIERIYWDYERGSEAAEKDIERGITPVFLKEDPDHGDVFAGQATIDERLPLYE